MSEFYALRRNAITDMSAFFGFLVGFLGSAPFAWPFLQVGFQTAEIVKGFAFFICVTMGAGVVCGAIGLGVGRAIGWFWERGHRVLRRAKGLEFAGDPHRARIPVAPTGGVAHRPPVTADDALPVIRYDAGRVAATDFAALMMRAFAEPLEAAPLGTSLGRTINIGAWDGDRLVGAVRLLTDGFRHSVVTDIVVDPAYRRQGIGRELMTRAAGAATGELSVARIPPGTEGFFRQLDAIPAYAGFVRGAKSVLH